MKLYSKIQASQIIKALLLRSKIKKKQVCHLKEKYTSQTTQVCLEELVDFKMQNAQVLIHKNTEENIIFDGNTGVYGGALYLNNANISDKTCKMKVKFINNTATASGNSLYFATMPQGVIPNCSFNDIQLTDISTPAFNMKYQGERVFSLIPGQTVYINVSVNDYYGSPSSCNKCVYNM